MSRISAPESVQNLRELLEEMESFSREEKELTSARFRQTSRLRQENEEEKERLEIELEEFLSKAETERDSKIEQLGEILDARIRRTEKAQIAVRSEVINRIQETQGERKGALQYRLIEAGKARDAAIAEANAHYEEKFPEAVEINRQWAQHEKRVVHWLRGFPAARGKVIRSLKAVGEAETSNRSAEALREDADDFAQSLEGFHRSPGIKLNHFVPVLIQVFLLLAVGGLAPFVMREWGDLKISYLVSLSIAGGLSIPLVLLYFRTRSRAEKFAEQAAGILAEAKEDRLGLKLSVTDRLEKTQREAEAAFARERSAFDTGLTVEDREGDHGSRYKGPADVEDRAEKLKTRIQEARGDRVESIQREYRDSVAARKAETVETVERLGEPSLSEESVAELDERREALVSRWDEALPRLFEGLQSECDSQENPLSMQGPGDWVPPKHFEEFLHFGTLFFKLDSEDPRCHQSDQLVLPAPLEFDLPLRLKVPTSASLLLETKSSRRKEAIQFLNYLTLGWLASSPAGRLSFSLIDPVGLGESFAGLMHLSDYEETLIYSRIQTREDQIEKRLGELCEHMEKVIQMYLRNDFETITEYNDAAGTIAERYHFLVVADFPNGFSELAVKRLQSIASSGARCGVFLLMHCDKRTDLPHGFQMEDLRKACLGLEQGDEGFFLRESLMEGHRVELAELPAAEEFAKWIHRIGEENRDSNRIEVPFSFIAPAPGDEWTRSTSAELTVPIGRSGATKLQELALGKGTCQHALIAGKTGSGKSTLFHVVITNLALWCDPEEVEFYLIDFKKGVEFKCYADHRLPHARVIAIESDREFGLSVLQRLDEELRERGEMFRKAGVQDMPGYRAAIAAQPDAARALPRTLLLIDEFQEFFIEDDHISQQAAVLLDRIVRQGRAFGIHAVLGSQTLGGAFTLARATLGQMTVRIALACNEADAYLIMDDSNPAPRLLSRPGEGIYNDRAGAAEANSPFQVVWVDERERDERLKEVNRWAIEKGKADGECVVFEGNAPGDVTTDSEVSRALDGGVTGDARIFLGAPNAIKGPTQVRFPRQSGANLLFVGPRDDVVEALIPLSLGLLRAQLGESARLILIHPQASDGKGDLASRVRGIEGVEVPSYSEMGAVLASLSEELAEVSGSGDGKADRSTFLFIPSLQRQKKLRFEEDFSFSMEEESEKKPATCLNELICEGPGWGFHVIVSVDSLNNVNRCLGRKAAGEFERKVLFQMSATDSASLIDSSAASGLGLNRALFYDEAEGNGEIFRPYAEPPQEWIAERFCSPKSN